MPEAAPTLVVFGAGGQVGRSLCHVPVPAGWTLRALSHQQGDITRPDQVAAALDGIHHGAVVNLAAYTQVDRAESEREAAFAINAGGAGVVARAAAAAGLPLIHISTDYVFPGTTAAPLTEDMPTGPHGVYGASKLAGEQEVAAAGGRALILRTAWVFGPHGNNFVKAILRRALAQPDLGVVADQHGCPTPAPAIAETLWRLARKLAGSDDAADFGIFHYCGDDPTTWFGFAQAILAEAAALGRIVGQARPIATADYPTPARRPAHSVLDCGKLARQHAIAAPSWRLALRTDLPGMLEAL